MATKKKANKEKTLTKEELAEIEELTGHLGPGIEISEKLQEDLAEVVSEDEEAEAQDADETAPSPDELEAIREEAHKNKDLYLRALAEMDNLRKRHQREKEEIAKFGNENILREILPVIDNLERAVEHATAQDGGTGLFEGVQMTLKQFSTALQKFGVEPLISQGEVFNPDHHQAIGQIESSEIPANHIAQEMQKGYLLNSRLLRPALVMIAKPPQPEAGNNVNPEPTEDNGEPQG